MGNLFDRWDCFLGSIRIGSTYRTEDGRYVGIARSSGDRFTASRADRSGAEALLRDFEAEMIATGRGLRSRRGFR